MLLVVMTCPIYNNIYVTNFSLLDSSLEQTSCTTFLLMATLHLDLTL